MKKEDRDYKLYVEDILLSIDRITEYISGFTYEDFRKDYRTVDAVIRNFEIIGEASRNIPERIRQNNSEIPWEEMYLLRNKVSHEYFGVDYEIIWDIAVNYLPSTRDHIEKLLETD
ncbi:MAG: DUF86 domain-containing protein [Bacteroidales bacterium]|nr:DUF86 domain-containing protein [Bacteroidales bacterium]